MWPSRQQVKKTLPSCFRKLYPKLKSGALLTALSALRRLQVVLIWQQPYGVSISITTRSRFLSQSHRMELFLMSLHVMKGGHLIFLLWGTVAFWRWLNLLVKSWQTGFKIREDLMMQMATLCIPPSCASSMQLLPWDVKETSNIANVQIYVEQAIGRLKVFLLLKNELPITLAAYPGWWYCSCLLCSVLFAPTTLCLIFLFVNMLSYYQMQYMNRCMKKITEWCVITF